MLRPRPRRLRLAVAWLTLTALPSIAATEDGRDFCLDRPGLGTPACTLDDGQVAIELGAVSWTLDRSAGGRSDTIATGDLLLRYGIKQNLEVQLGWDGFATTRVRSGGRVEKASGTGDVLLAVRHNLQNPDGSGFSLAVMPYATLPVGSSATGAGDWGAGLLLPASQDLPAGFGIGLTGSVEAAVDEDRGGRHLAYGAIVGIDVPLSETVGATAEFPARCDDDPSGASAGLMAGVSAGWAPVLSLQPDVGTTFGLNHHVSDVQLYFGIARRF